MMHLAVLLYGLTGILGKEISLSGPPLVWYRMGITLLSILFFRSVWRHLPQLSRREIGQFAGIGVLMAIHWVTFFESIKLSNVSVALSALSTTAFLTSMLEPLVFRKKIQPVEVVMGLIVIAGLALIFRFTPSGMYAGMFVGLFSALVVALASVWNKSVMSKAASVYPVLLVEFAAGWLLLSLLMPLFLQSGYGDGNMVPTGRDWVLLLVLALACTTLAYSLNMKALQHLTAFASNLLINLEPVYAILIAAWLYKEYEELHAGFYVGTAIILAAVALYPLLLRRKTRA